MKASKRYEASVMIPRVVDFAEGPLQTGPEARELLRRVLHTDTGFVVLGDPDLSGVNVLRLRNDFRSFLRTGLERDTGQLMPAARVELAPTIVGGNKIVVTVDGHVRDVLWFQFIRLMQMEGVDRIRLCDCGRVFVKTGRREFCSTRCQKRVYMRRFRTGEAGRE